MEKRNYKSPLALGTLAVAGTLAALIPPSTIMIIYGTACEVSIGRVFIAGIFPGLVLTALMSVYIFARASINPSLAPAGELSTLKEKIKVLPQLLPALLLFIAIIGGIYAGIWTAIEASAGSVFITLLICLAYRRLNWGAVKDALFRTVRISGMIYMIVVGANILGYLFFVTGFQTAIKDIVLSFALPGWGIIILMLLIMTVLGTFLDVIALILICVPIFLAIVLALGYSDVWFGIIMVAASEMALCTPPVGVNLFVIQGVAPKGTTLMDVAKGAAPYIGLIWLLLLLLIAFPELATWLPSTMIT
jgi:tripartite ATP-independent transporter DctM subunit